MHLLKKSLEGDTFYCCKVIYDLFISLNRKFLAAVFFRGALWGEIQGVIRLPS